MSDESGAYAYMLRCADGSYYVGSARLGLEQRIGEHNAGTYGGYTSTRRPVTLVWAEHSNSSLTPLLPSGASKAGRAQRRER